MKNLLVTLLLLGPMAGMKGYGQFGAGVEVASQFSAPQDIKAADLDGDLDQDIVLRNNGALVWSRNDGQGIFGPVDTLYASNWPTSWYYWFDLSDIELDGDLDVVVLNVQDSLLLWLPNTGGASFAPAQVIADLHGHGALASMICSDIMGDPSPDVIVNEETMNKRMVYINDSGTFGTTDSIFGGMWGPMVPALVADDIDLDGDRDMVIQHWSGQVLALLNSGGAGNSWTDTLMIATGGPFFINNGQNLQLLDVDANGDLDLADAASDNTPVWAENFAADSGGFRHFLPQWIGPGGGINGHAGWLAHIGCGVQASALWTGGPDRDTMRWSVFDAQLDAFAPPTYWASEPGIRLIRTADLNGDGAQDLILSHGDSLVTWYPNLLPQQPNGAVSLTPFDTLCVNGDPYPLEHAMPAGGTWTGAGVAANTYSPAWAPSILPTR
ncbi:MAG: VCBS repeat-containing protein [Flavobacteriales bacterium]|nr:VCBS repeat-containing protein [Flavobacteriales bacterium]